MHTVLHELCHNVIAPHDRDFWTVYYNVATECGLKESAKLRALTHISNSPEQPQFQDKVAVSVGGVKVLLDADIFCNHFSAYKDHDSQKIVHLPRKYHPSLVVRLIQLAKGLDPADADTYFGLPNKRDYYSHNGRLPQFKDDYRTLDTDAGRVLDFYLDLYKAGEELGWHPSSRDWLVKELYNLLNYEPRERSGPRAWPKFDSKKELTVHVAESIGRICLETTLKDQCLQDIAIEVLTDMVLSLSDSDRPFDLEILQALYDKVPEVARDLCALFEQDIMVAAVSSASNFKS